MPKYVIERPLPGAGQLSADEDIVYEHARCGGFPAESVSLVSAVIDPSTGE